MKPYLTLAETTTPDGARLSLNERDGDYYMDLDGHRLMTTRATGSETELAEVGCEHLGGAPKPRILIGGLGFGFTLRRALKSLRAGAEIEVAELLPEVVDWNRTHLAALNGGCLDDPRVTLRVEDVGRILAAAPDAHYDALLLDVDNGPVAWVAGANRDLYSRAGLRQVARVLKTQGRAVFWSANRDDPFLRRLKKTGFATHFVLSKPWAQAKRASHILYVGDKKRGM